MKDKVEWRYAKVEEFAYLTKGRTPTRAKKEYYATSGLPWVKIENLKRRTVCASEEYLSKVGAMQGKTVPAGSVLLSVNRTIGKVGIAGVPLQTNEQIIAITCIEPEELLPEYLYYYLIFSEKTLRRRAYVTVSSRISMGMLKDIIVPIAPPEYQQRCVARLQIIEALIWKKEDMAIKLKQYRSSLHNGKQRSWTKGNVNRAALVKELDELAKLLEQSTQVAQRLLRSVLERIFRAAEKKKEDVYYGKDKRSWHTIDEIWQLDESIKQLLRQMSFFQQCLYRAFYSADVPSAIHVILKQIKQLEPSLESYHIQDAVTAVESFRQMGLMAQREKRKLYYTAEETETNEITKEDGANLTISLWGCTFPNNNDNAKMAE